ncbi:hypothetical protein B0H16DRAFT_1460123 [Mycena metata]|uniref:Uncharacterized protein n=1 Tax=Mycena metata TaxID=1033252 RepID=A0AAD7N991_9AGAR|nr:hypothetical protein B0H16DRAFT_1460123 [Mycena metata]
MAGSAHRDTEMQALIAAGEMYTLPDFDQGGEFNFPDALMPSSAAGSDVAMAALESLAPAADPYGSGFAGPLSTDLLMRLEGLDVNARNRRIAKLKKMSTEELVHENNNARNYYMMRGLGLGDTEKETLWGGAVAPPQRPKRKGHDGEEEEVKEAEEPEAQARAMVWAVKAKEFLSNAELGADRAVGVMMKSHRTKNQPKEVSDWVSRARNYTPAVNAPDDLGNRWWVWWNDINLTWRETTCPMERTTGPNGFLNILMVLKWWRDAMKEVSPDWEEAVGDVTWVLHQMRNEKEGRTVTPPVQLVLCAPAVTPGMVGPEGTENTANSLLKTASAPTDRENTQTIIPQARPLTFRRQTAEQVLNSALNPNLRAQEETSSGVAKSVIGEGLSQEELDEMEDDPDADMEE